MSKVFIKNRKNQNISVLIERADNQNGLAFVMHGLGGFKEQPHIETFAKAFKDNNHTVIRFDATNSLASTTSLLKDNAYAFIPYILGVFGAVITLTLIIKGIMWGIKKIRGTIK